MSTVLLGLSISFLAATSDLSVRPIASSKVVCNGLTFQLSIGKDKKGFVTELTIRRDDSDPRIVGSVYPILDTRLTARDGRSRVYDQFSQPLDSYTEARITETTFATSVSLSSGSKLALPLDLGRMLDDLKAKGSIMVDMSFTAKRTSYAKWMWDEFYKTSTSKFLWLGNAQLPTIVIKAP